MPRILALASLAAGACWLAMGVSSLFGGETSDTRLVLEGTGDYLGFGLFALALGLTVPAILGLHRHQDGADGRLGSAGAVAAMLGAGAQCVVISTIVATGEEPSWFGVAAPLAILTWLVGSILLGVAIRRARLLPGWVGVVLPVVTLFAIVGSDYGSSVGIGLYLVLVGVRLARAAGATARRPAYSL